MSAGQEGMETYLGSGQCLNWDVEPLVVTARENTSRR
jgi:hypothetical protein